jgi:hypothetical protein
MNTENTMENGNVKAEPIGETTRPEDGPSAGHSRTGKIARLPAALRQELNQRLQDGQPEESLAEWLNALPAVQAVLAAQFKGQPILQKNVSRWKQGGYQDWVEEKKTAAEVAAVFEKSDSLPAAAQEGLTARMGLLLAAKMAAEVNRLDAVPEGKRRSKMWRKLLRCLAVLRRGECHGERLQVEREKLAFRRQRHQQEREEEFWQWIEKAEHRDRILERLLTPEQLNEEIARRNAETQRMIKDALGIR